MSKDKAGLHNEPDLEANGEGLLWVDLLSLPVTFSWRRYRIDLIGFLVASFLVAALMLLLALVSLVLQAG